MGAAGGEDRRPRVGQLLFFLASSVLPSQSHTTTESPDEYQTEQGHAKVADRRTGTTN